MYHKSTENTIKNTDYPIKNTENLNFILDISIIVNIMGFSGTEKYRNGGAKMFEYKMLKLKIKEVYDTQEAFAEAIGMSYTALNQRLNNAVEWKTPEIAKACELLHIELKHAYIYFFTLKVQKSTESEG